MDQILFDVGLTFLLFWAGLQAFLLTGYYRRLVTKREFQRKEKADAGDAAGAEALDQELVLLRLLAPLYARRLRNIGAVLVVLYLMVRLIR